MIPRLHLFGIAAGLAFAGWLGAQEPQRPGDAAKAEKVVLSFTVTDSKGRYVKGLKASDLRILEDEIPQKISTFTEVDPTEPGEASSYTVTYDPDPSNRNQGFRKIRIDIPRDIAKRWRIRSKAGYRPVGGV